MSARRCAKPSPRRDEYRSTSRRTTATVARKRSPATWSEPCPAYGWPRRPDSIQHVLRSRGSSPPCHRRIEHADVEDHRGPSTYSSTRFGRVCQGVQVTKYPDQAFDAFLGSLLRRWLPWAMWLDDDRENRAVFRQLQVLLPQHAEELASQRWGDPQRTDLSSRLPDGLSGHRLPPVCFAGQPPRGSAARTTVADYRTSGDQRAAPARVSARLTSFRSNLWGSKSVALSSPSHASMSSCSLVGSARTSRRCS